MAGTSRAAPWQAYRDELDKLREGNGIPRVNVRAALGELLCDAWQIDGNLSDREVREAVRIEFEQYRARLTLRDLTPPLTDDLRKKYIQYAEFIIPATFNMQDKWLDVGLNTRRAAAADRNSIGFSDKGTSTWTRCEKALIEDIAKQITNTAVTRVHEARFRGIGDLTADDELLQPYLAAIARKLMLRNEEEKRTLLGERALDVGWKASAGDFGGNSEQLRVRLLGMKVPQMVLLGPPGSGKTTMATTLINELYKRLQAHVAVDKCTRDLMPVRLSIATLKANTNIFEWMLKRLSQEYPEINSELEEIGRLALQEYFLQRWTLPVLDGFDEIRSELQPMILQNLHKDFQGRPLILTSRTNEFLQISNAFKFLPECDRIVLQPVKAEESSAYLAKAVPGLNFDAGGALVGGSAEFIGVTTSPLTIWLLSEIQPTETMTSEELLHFPNAESIQVHLFRRLIPAVFERYQRTTRFRDTLSASHADPGEAQAAFTWLARRLWDRGTATISWWQIQDIVPRIWLILGSSAVAGLVAGAISGRSAIGVAIQTALYVGAFFGFGFGRGYSSSRKKGAVSGGRSPYAGINKDTDPEFRAHLVRFGAAILGASVFLASAWTATWALHSGHLPWLQLAPFPLTWRQVIVRAAVASLLSLMIAFIFGRIIGWVLKSAKFLDKLVGGAQATTPQAALKKDGQNTAMAGAICFAVCAIALFAIFRSSVISVDSLFFVALASVIPSSLIVTAWSRYRVVHLWLSLFRGKIPPYFMTLLDDAHQGGVLRQSGLSYNFRHDLLRVSLTTSEQDSDRQG